MQLKPQDFLVALKLVVWANQRWTYARLAQELGLSTSECHACVKRGLQAGLLMSNPVWAAAPTGSMKGLLEEPGALYRFRARPHRARKPAPEPGFVSDVGAIANDNPARAHPQNLAEFAVHGARYAFPAERLPSGPGVPTCHHAPAISDWLGAGTSCWVWPHAHGEVQGQGLEPLHPCVPYAVVQDAVLYEMLALFDLLRVGEEPDRNAVGQRLHRRIDPQAGAAGQELPRV